VAGARRAVQGDVAVPACHHHLQHNRNANISRA
jgi:hypothetical protein